MTTESHMVTVEIPCELLDTVREHEKWGGGVASRLRMSLAVGLYAEHAVSLARSAELAGVTIQEFESFLRRAGLPTVVYSETEFLQDVAFVRECERDAGHGS